MAESLGETLDDVVERATSAATMQSAADAMSDALLYELMAILGADLRMSHFPAGPVRPRPEGVEATATVTVGGSVWGLATGGRRRPFGARARPGSALDTPWGPRASVEGSTSPGLGKPDETVVLQAGVDAVHDAVFAEAG